MAATNKKGRKTMITGGILSLAGFLFGISPFIVMYVQGLGGNPPANEAEPGGAVG